MIIGRSSFAILGCMAVVCSPARVFGQETGRNAVVHGTIYDVSNRPVAGVTITAQHVRTGELRQAISTDRGTYRIEQLYPGDYRITARRDGYALMTRGNVVLSGGDPVVLDFALTREHQLEPVLAVAASRDAAVTPAIPRRTLDSTTIRALPSVGRRHQDLVLMTPGAIAETQRGETSLGGQRGINLAYNVDGVSYDNAFFGGSRGGERGPSIYTISLEAIEGVSVFNAGYPAEFGRSGGGVVNLRTKSGTNEFHGSAFEYFRSATLTADDPYGRPPVEFRQHQFGMSFSGPIRRDVAHFFFAFDQQLHSEPFTIAFGTDPRGVPRFEGQDGTFRRTNNVTTAFLRFDWRLARAGHLSIRTHWARNTAENDILPERVRMRTIANTGVEHDEIASVAASHTVELRGRFLNTLRAAFFRETRPRHANSLLEPQITVAGFGITGQSDILPSDIADDRLQFVEIISGAHGNHTWRAGAEINFTRPRQSYFLSRNGGEYFFNSLNDYMITVTTGEQRWSSYRQGFGRPDTDMTQQEYAAFLEDAFKITPTLTATFGLRYEVQLQPQPDHPNPQLIGSDRIPSDYNNVAPRLGLEWRPSNGEAGVVRLHGGVYFSRTPAILLVAPFRVNGVAQQMLRFTPNDPGAPVFPARLVSPPTGTVVPPSDVFRFHKDFENPRTLQVVAEYERTTLGGIVVDAQLQHARMSSLERLVDVNLGPPSGKAADGRTLFRNPRPDPRFGRIVEAQSSARGTYSSISIGARKNVPSARGAFIEALDLRFHYTYSLSKDDDSNERDARSTSYQDITNLDAEYTWSNNDVRHNFVLVTNARLKNRLNLAAVLRARSGTPYSKFSAVDLNSDGNTNGTDRLYVDGRDTGRNSFRQPRYSSLDLRLTWDVALLRRAHIEAGLDIFNALNAENRFVSSTNRTFTGVGSGELNPNLGIPDVQLGEPRNAQLSMRVSF